MNDPLKISYLPLDIHNRLAVEIVAWARETKLDETAAKHLASVLAAAFPNVQVPPIAVFQAAAPAAVMIPVWATSRSVLVEEIDKRMLTITAIGDGSVSSSETYLQIECPRCLTKTKYTRDDIPRETHPCPKCGAPHIVYGSEMAT